jgi:hypothetical protein
MVAATGVSLAASTLLIMQSASAAIPTFPNNVVVFPDRDFVSIEGYQDHVGETALVEVKRDGVVVGSAKSIVSGTDVAFEINHPGGVCWGADTTDKVTPDIKAGDVVSITFPDKTHDETTTSSATVTENMVLNGTTLTINGTLGADVSPARFEQRVINPDLGDTDVGKRDIRALVGPMEPAPSGAYTSGVAVTGDTFVATYEFTNAATAEIAAAADLGERAMSWQEEDIDANRQGLTIAEFGELGGPGMGGCPAGPGDQAAPTPGAATVVRSADKTSMQVKWTAATPQAGSAAVTGYSVVAIAPAGANGQQAQLGMRTDAAANQTLISGLDPAVNYDVEVRSMTGPKMGEAFTIGAAATPAPGDATAPTLEVSPAPSADGSAVETDSVTATSDGQIFFTDDGSPVVSGDLPSDSAQLYTEPIPVTAASTTVKVAAFDQVGNMTLSEGLYSPPNTPVAPPAAPTGLNGTAGQGSVTLKWTAGDATATNYQIAVYNADGTALVDGVQPPAGETLTQTVTGLTGGTTYQFSVKAMNAAGLASAETDKITLTPTAVTDRVTITSARWKSGDFRVEGTGSQVGATVTVLRATATGPGDPIAGASAGVTAVAPPGIGAYSIRLRNGSAPAQNPGQIYVKSSAGGVAGPFTVSN